MPGLLVFAALGCGHHELPPAPLGSVSSVEEVRQGFVCLGDIVMTRVCGRDPWTPFCALSRSPSGVLYGLDGRALAPGHGALATERIRCEGRPGWVLWTDRRHRIVGACGDPGPLYSGTEFVRQQLDYHLGHPNDLVTRESVLSLPGLHTWTEPVGLELRHEPDGSIIEDRSKVRPGAPAGCLEVILDD